MEFDLPSARDEVELRSNQSSPDPLALSPSPPPKARKSIRSDRRSKLLSARTSARFRDTEDTTESTKHVFTSPAVSTTMSTGAPAPASPWRIRVTVEAEPPSQGHIDDDGATASARFIERRRTVAVPLKGSDESSPVKRRGRPRKSDTAATSKPKRNGTPVRRRRSAAKTSSVPKLDEDSAADDSQPPSSPPKRRRGRPRKSLQQTGISAKDVDGTVTESQPQEQEPAGMIDLSTEPQDQRPQHPKRSAFDFANLTPLHEKHVLHTPQPRGRRTPTTNFKSVHGRKCTPVKPTSWSEEGLSVLPASSPPRKGTVTNNEASEEDQDAEMWRAMVERRDESEGSAGLGAEQSDEEVDDDATEAVGEETMLQSEGFSMVSIDSLPSMQEARSSPASARQDQTSEPQTAARNSNDTESLAAQLKHRFRSCIRTPISQAQQATRTNPTPSYIRSSPPVKAVAQITPAVYDVPLSQPPPIESSYITPHKTSTPARASVVKAGTALQDVLDTPSHIDPPSSGFVTSNAQSNTIGSLFGGFGEGTRRQLQAGLKLGEQLAQHSHHDHSSHDLIATHERSTVGQSFHTTNENALNILGPNHAQAIGYPRLPTPQQTSPHTVVAPPPSSRIRTGFPHADSNRSQEAQPVSRVRSEDEMSWQPDTPPSTTRDVSDSEHSGAKRVDDKQAISYIEATKPDMIEQMQTEMEAASPSASVIQANEDDTDIWEEEASRSSDLPSLHPVQHEQHAEQNPQLVDLFANDDSLLKPRRSKLPKTWRRVSANNFNYSDEAEPEEATMLSAGQHRQTEPESANLHRDKSAVNQSNASFCCIAQPDAANAEDETGASSQEPELTPDDEVDDTGIFWQQKPSIVPQRPRRSVPKSDKMDLTVLSALDGTSHTSGPLGSCRKIGASTSSPLRSSTGISSFYKNHRHRCHLRSDDVQEDEESEDSDNSVTLGRVTDTMTSDVRQIMTEMAAHAHSAGSRTEVTNTRSRLSASTQLSNPANAEEEEEYEEEVEEIEEEEVVEEVIEEVVEEEQIEEYLGDEFEEEDEEEHEASQYDDYEATQYNHYDPSFTSADANTTLMPPRHRPEPLPSTSPPPAPPALPAPPAPQQSKSSFLGRLWSLLPTLPLSNPTHPTHPLLANLPLLPATNPWTKTHYQTLSTLFDALQARPELFSPRHPDNAELWTAEWAHYAGYSLTKWRYTVTLTPPLLILSALFWQLLQCEGQEEYERLSGRKLEVDFLRSEHSVQELRALGVKREGRIAETDVLIRVFSLVAADMVRADEARGYWIDRTGRLEIRAPVRRV